MKIPVDADALRQVLMCLSGPGHYIRELQATQGLPYGMGGEKNPINILHEEYGKWVKTVTYKELTEKAPPTDAERIAASDALAPWLSAALEDQNVSDEFKTAVTNWFAAARPALVMSNAEIMDSYQSMQEELKWVKDVIAEHLGYDGPLAPACCPLAEALTKAEAVETTIEHLEASVAVKQKQLDFARGYAQKCDLIMKGYLPKILQLTALLKRARVDVNYSFQMNADLERHQVFTPADTVEVTMAADKYQEFLDEIDAALWVPPDEEQITTPPQKTLLGMRVFVDVEMPSDTLEIRRGDKVLGRIVGIGEDTEKKGEPT